MQPLRSSLLHHLPNLPTSLLIVHLKIFPYSLICYTPLNALSKGQVIIYGKCIWLYAKNTTSEFLETVRDPVIPNHVRADVELPWPLVVSLQEINSYSTTFLQKNLTCLTAYRNFTDMNAYRSIVQAWKNRSAFIHTWF